jgi:hypothetical protein
MDWTGVEKSIEKEVRSQKTPSLGLGTVIKI